MYLQDLIREEKNFPNEGGKHVNNAGWAIWNMIECLRLQNKYTVVQYAAPDVSGYFSSAGTSQHFTARVYMEQSLHVFSTVGICNLPYFWFLRDVIQKYNAGSLILKECICLLWSNIWIISRMRAQGLMTKKTSGPSSTGALGELGPGR